MAKDTLGINAGQFYTECGKLDSGNSPRFYLGRIDEVSEDEARVRRAHVRSFWERTQSDRPNENEHGIWSDVTLGWAKQVAKGATTITIGKEINLLTTTPFNLSLHSKIADSLSRTYAGIVRFVLPAHVTQYVGKVAQSVEGAASKADGADDGEKLYKWLDAFADHAFTTMLKIDDETQKHEQTEWAKVFSEAVRRLKDWADEIPLNRFGYPELERIVQKIASRPISKKSGLPISVKYTRHSLKALRRFIRWLPKHAPNWKKPEDWEDLFEQHRPTATDEEKSQRAIGKVKSYTREQLHIIYRYATPFERQLFLLGINCGFGAAELSTLRLREVVLSADGDSYIKRVRLKTESGVYGEHWLFPHTVLALEWAIERAKKIKGVLTPKSFVILRDSGKRIVTKTASGNRTNKAANTWAGLTKRIRHDDPAFPALSFGKLRKTAGNLIKSVSDGETVAVFHQRSSAVKQDDEAEAYTDRLYERVFVAQRKILEQLRPMFDAVPDPFPEHFRKNYIGQKKIAAIKQMWSAGQKPDAIVRGLGVSRATAYRYKPASEREVSTTAIGPAVCNEPA